MMKRTVCKIHRGPQLSLFDVGDAKRERLSAKTRERRFVEPDPNDIYLGSMGLRDYLKQLDLKAPLVIRELLEEEDWQSFKQQYERLGRAPYSPMSMMGLILYGVQNGIHSLRGLERYARTDLGCMWVSGGIAPDHSVIGDFILRHAGLITGGLFESLTAAVLRRTGSHGQQLAGDGTVIAAACSHYGLLHAEAVEAACEKTQTEAEKAPDDAVRQNQRKRAELARELLRERVDNKRSKGKKTDQLRISGTEPEAMVQRQKRGRGSAPSYKPSILVNEQRVVVAQAVDASSETAVLSGLLDQSAAVSGERVETLLLDAGYCCDSVIEASLNRDIDLLCPQGRKPGQGKRSDKYYTKACFDYDESTDSYRCPAGESLTVISRYKGKGKTPGYTQYGTRACQSCPYKTACTRSKTGRRIKRYAGDEYKEALRRVMAQPKAKALFAKRQAWVEPVFSVLRGVQGLNRFRRRGLSAVNIEFGLHILAYNLSRAIAWAILGLCQWQDHSQLLNPMIQALLNRLSIGREIGKAQHAFG